MPRYKAQKFQVFRTIVEVDAEDLAEAEIKISEGIDLEEISEEWYSSLGRFVDYDFEIEEIE